MPLKGCSRIVRRVCARCRLCFMLCCVALSRLRTSNSRANHQDNYMKGQAAVNTTRDYIRAAVFFANSAILLTTFTVGFAGVAACL